MVPACLIWPHPSTSGPPTPSSSTIVRIWQCGSMPLPHAGTSRTIFWFLAVPCGGEPLPRLSQCAPWAQRPLSVGCVAAVAPQGAQTRRPNLPRFVGGGGFAGSGPLCCFWAGARQPVCCAFSLGVRAWRGVATLWRGGVPGCCQNSWGAGPGAAEHAWVVLGHARTRSHL